MVFLSLNSKFWSGNSVLLVFPKEFHYFVTNGKAEKLFSEIRRLLNRFHQAMPCWKLGSSTRFLINVLLVCFLLPSIDACWDVSMFQRCLIYQRVIIHEKYLIIPTSRSQIMVKTSSVFHSCFDGGLIKSRLTNNYHALLVMWCWLSSII